MIDISHWPLLSRLLASFAEGMILGGIVCFLRRWLKQLIPKDTVVPWLFREGALSAVIVLLVCVVRGSILWAFFVGDITAVMLCIDERKPPRRKRRKKAARKVTLREPLLAGSPM